MTTKRNVLLMGAGAVVLPILGCTNGAIDPTKVIDAIKTACGIVVPAATVVTIINAAIGATVQMIVDIVCTGYHSAMAANKLTASAGTSVKFPVVVNGKTIEVTATVQ